MCEHQERTMGLTHSGFFTDALVGYNMTASHAVKDDVPTVQPSEWVPAVLGSHGRARLERAGPVALRALPHGQGTAGDGPRLLMPHSLVAMRSNPGPGGTLTMEVDGVCVTWWQRRTAEGVPVFQHGGSWGGQNSVSSLYRTAGLP